LNKSATILCIDDEERWVNIRRRLLESGGHRVITATSGQQGLDIFWSEHVDAVVLDYWMPDVKGLDVAREMKRLRPKIPILILSGYATLADEALGIADAWIQKGDDPKSLLSKIQELIGD
jgi:CheY-like chemotaxis protein